MSPKPNHTDQDKEELFFYFLNLNQNFRGKDDLAYGWGALPQYSFTPKEISNILLKAAGHIRRFPDDNVRRECIRYLIKNQHIWEQVALETLEDFNPQNLANTLAGFARLKVRPTEKFMLAWEKQVKRKMAHFSFQELASIMRSYGNLGIHPSEEILNQWEVHATKRLQTKTGRKLVNEGEDINDEGVLYFTQSLTLCLLGYARLGLKPPEQFIQKWQDYTFKKINLFQTRDISDAMYACAVLHALTKDERYRRIFERFYNALDIGAADKIKMHGAYHAYLWFEKHWPEEFGFPVEGAYESRDERTLKSSFRKAKISLKRKPAPIGNTGHHADFVPVIDEHVHFEADGGLHFTRQINPNTRKYDLVGYTGYTQFQSALMHKSDTECVLIRIPLTVYNEMENMKEQNRNLKLAWLMEEAMHTKPGAYEVTYNSDRDKMNIEPMLIAALS